MKTSVCRTFRFEAAHYLPNYEGKCKNLHGHTWILEVEIVGPVTGEGFVMDFAKLKHLVNEKVVDVLDHTCLNDLGVSFSSNPTCEHLLAWMWHELECALLEMFLRGSIRHAKPELRRLRLCETHDSFAELRV